MATNESKLVRDLVGAIKDGTKERTKAYETPATVTRVEDGVAWVHIPGGVQETPVQLTINASEGDTVRVRVANGRATIVGNVTSPPTDDATAKEALSNAADALQSAVNARRAADSAEASAATASAAAQDALETAESVHDIAVQAQTDAETAKTSAENASEYAARALGNLSTVQSVTETLNWITQHGTMTPTTDTELDPTHVYFVVDPNGDYTVGGTKYAVVTEPSEDDLSSYYELSIDESLNNYVATHLAVTSEGLWLIPEDNASPQNSSKKILIAVGGQGHSYPVAGTYIMEKVSGVDEVIAKFTASGATIGRDDDAHTIIDADGMQIYSVDSSGGLVQLANLGFGDGRSQSGMAEAPYYTFGTRKSGSVVGNYSVVEGFEAEASGAWSHAEGNDTTASDGCSHAEGASTTASGAWSHAEGNGTTASDGCSHAEGNGTTASGWASHAEGHSTIASGDYAHAQNRGTKAGNYAQTAIGKYNDNKSNNALEVGNGTSNTKRSNAFSVDWDGNVRMCLNKYQTIGNVDETIYDALNALGWLADCVES